ncbi:MAG: MFS transporter [Alteromonadaceae bacterium]|nr:MFS transporter [Alteromonadaceae bacterium]
MVPYLAVLILGGGPSGQMVIGMGTRNAMILGLVLSAIGLWLLAGFGPNYVVEILPGLVLLPAGTSLVFAASAVLMTQGVSPVRMGLAGGVMNTAMELGPTAGLAGFMALASLRTEIEAGWSLVFMSAGGVAFLLAVSACFVLKRLQVTGAWK